MLDPTPAGSALLTLAEEASAGAPQDVLFFSLAGLAALVTLSALEIVLGIDNVVFIAIKSGRLPPEQQKRARTIGLLLAMVMRLVLLGGAYWIMQLNRPFTTVLGVDVSGKTIILLLGGLFLVANAIREIHHLLEGEHEFAAEPKAVSFRSVITQILLLDLVFSIDSVITAVGMTTNYAIMATAVILSVGVMLAFAGPIASFVEKHPTMKTLALSFLILIGVLLIAEGLGQHFDRGYVYFAMGFALFVEVLNMRIMKRKRARMAAQSAR